MADDDEDDKIAEKELQEIKIHYTDIKDKEIEEKIIKYANDSLEGTNMNDKEICMKLKKALDTDITLAKPSNPGGQTGEDEQGVWQILVGRSFSSSVTFDSEYLVYFSFPKLSKYFMVFRS